MPGNQLTTLHLFLLLCQALIVAFFSLVPPFFRKKLLNVVMRPFKDPADSVKEDVWLLRNAPLMPREIPIYGLVGAVQ